MTVFLQLVTHFFFTELSLAGRNSAVPYCSLLVEIPQTPDRLLSTDLHLDGQYTVREWQQVGGTAFRCFMCAWIVITGEQVAPRGLPFCHPRATINSRGLVRELSGPRKRTGGLEFISALCSFCFVSYIINNMSLALWKNKDWGRLLGGCWGEYLELRGMKWQMGGDNCIRRSFIICTLYQVVSWSDQEGWDGLGM